MKPIAFVLALSFSGTLSAGGRYFEVKYPASSQPGELQMAVTYTMWVPDGVKIIRGVMVHQHGCGTGACKGGATAAYDLHWQALAKKWSFALLGPSYDQAEKQDCRLWSDPRNGSDKTFLKALADLAEKSKHAELKSAPWCLWGHSGGGYWAGVMQALHPERIIAIWFRSGATFGAIEMPDAAYGIPVMLNPGAKEKDHKQFARIWTGNLESFEKLRGKGAPAGYAPDPKTAHECGDSRYLAIPFFDACVRMRLDKNGKIQPVDLKQGTRAEESGWLPGAQVAKAWAEYVKTGTVGDTTAPPAPFAVKAARKDGAVEVTWDAEADFESGIREFIIQRDGKEIGRVPEKPVGRFGRPLFQSMSYHDTPEAPVPAMRFVDRDASAGKRARYSVIAVNGVELRSQPSATSRAAR